jgi:NADH:ubiquinone oxidoreductase subunit
MGAPPKVYNPQYMTGKNFLKRLSEVTRKEGWFGAYNKLRMESTFRKGTLVGTDANGNKYYQDLEAPYGRTRWVEYPTMPGVFGIDLKFDGSMVSPEWHGWLHYMHDKTGTELVRPRAKAFPRTRTLLPPPPPIS